MHRSQGSTDSLPVNKDFGARANQYGHEYLKSENDTNTMNTLEKMDLDELHSLQGDLKKKIQTTNQLIESKSRASSFRSSSAAWMAWQMSVA